MLFRWARCTLGKAPSGLITVRLRLKNNICDRLHVNAAIAWCQLASTKWVKIFECDVKSDKELVNDNQKGEFRSSSAGSYKTFSIDWFLASPRPFCRCNSLIAVSTAFVNVCPESNPLLLFVPYLLCRCTLGSFAFPTVDYMHESISFRYTLVKKVASAGAADELIRRKELGWYVETVW